LSELETTIAYNLKLMSLKNSALKLQHFRTKML